MKAKTHSVANSIYNVITFLARWGMLIFSGFLFLSAFLFDSYSTDMDTQDVLFRRDDILKGVLILITVILITTGLQALKPRTLKPLTKGLFVLALLAEICLGIWFIFYGRCLSGADPYIVYKMGEMVANGDLGVIHPTDSYLSYYPHQIGLMTFYALFIKASDILHLGRFSYDGLKAVNVIAAALSLVMGYDVLKRVKERSSETADSLFTLLFLLFAPVIMYTSYVYGEILSVFAMFGAVCFLARLFEELRRIPLRPGRAVVYGIIASLFTGFGTYVRKNTLVFMIAVLIVLFAEFVKCLGAGTREKLKKLLPVAVTFILTLTLSLGALPATVRIYEGLTGRTLPSGVTATSYFAMGMQQGTRGPGWYNGFNYVTYQDSGLNADKANEVSRKAMEERLEYFKANPGEALKFYWEKHLSLWADGTYASRQATYSSDSRKEAHWSLYNGLNAGKYMVFCNAFQTVLYFGFFVYCLLKVLERESRLTAYLIPVAVFGTFLFHILWEANSRYVFPASVLLTPVSAAGLSSLAFRAHTLILKITNKTGDPKHEG